MLQSFQNGTNPFLQISFVLDRLFAELTMLQFIPDLLVWIEFRRMRRKEEYPNLSAVCSNKFTNYGGFVK